MANNADKIRDINSVGWDGLEANVHQLRLKDTDAQRKLDMRTVNVLELRKARTF